MCVRAPSGGLVCVKSHQKGGDSDSGGVELKELGAEPKLPVKLCEIRFHGGPGAFESPHSAKAPGSPGSPNPRGRVDASRASLPTRVSDALPAGAFRRQKACGPDSLFRRGSERRDLEDAAEETD